MVFEFFCASHSCLMHQIIAEKSVSTKSRGYRLPSNHCHQGETDPGFEFPTSSYPRELWNFLQSVSSPRMFFWPGYRHTDTQTDNHLFRKTLLSVEGTSSHWRSIQFEDTYLYDFLLIFDGDNLLIFNDQPWAPLAKSWSRTLPDF